MKKNHIIIGLMIIAGISLIVSASGDLATYATFKDAIDSQQRVKIVGDLAKDLDIIYDPEVDPNLMKFHLTDNDGITKQVLLTHAKPQDFERSEKITITGAMEGDVFIADEMLLKCPSKYKDEETLIRANS